MLSRVWFFCLLIFCSSCLSLCKEVEEWVGKLYALFLKGIESLMFPYFTWIVSTSNPELTPFPISWKVRESQPSYHYLSNRGTDIISIFLSFFDFYTRTLFWPQLLVAKLTIQQKNIEHIWRLGLIILCFNISFLYKESPKNLKAHYWVDQTVLTINGVWLVVVLVLNVALAFTYGVGLMWELRTEMARWGICWQLQLPNFYTTFSWQ